MELLAPAGSFAALRAAVENGADAVYLGGKSYSARASAANFSDCELQGALDYCHVRGVKVYVTVNTLLRDEELGHAFAYLTNLYTWGVDGVIIQDLGLASLVRSELPQLELHGSTQMTLHNHLDLAPLEDLGFKRVVLARELDLKTIQEIHRSTNLELEVFVHGALCICYSGQCLMSSFIGGRSGNRGQCAQPCRKGYRIDGFNTPGEYVLSPKDLSLIDELEPLRDAGVVSLKIEGRLKSPDYVGVVVRTYRAALDGHPYQGDDLATVFNRGFTKAYLHGSFNPQLITYQKNPLGDRSGSALETYTSPKAFRRVSAHLWAEAGLDQVLILNLLDSDGFHVRVEGEVPAEKARNQSLTEEILQDKLLRLGNDPLEILEFQAEIEADIYLPVSEINNTRRKLVQEWEKTRLAPYKNRQRLEITLEPRTVKGYHSTTPRIAVTVSDLLSAQGALEAGADLVYFSGQVYRRAPKDWLHELTEVWKLGQSYGVPIFVHLERITEHSTLANLAVLLRNHRYDGALVGNLGTWELIQQINPHLPIFTDWSFNVFNGEAVQFLAKQGASCVTLSLELRLNQIQEITKTAPIPTSLVVHGPLESMVTKHCIYRDQGCRFQCQAQGPLTLRDEKGFEFPVYFDRWCHMHLFNSRELSLLDHVLELRQSGAEFLRVEGRLKEPGWIREIVGLYKRGLQGENVEIGEQEFTKGHYFRGVT